MRNYLFMPTIVILFLLQTSSLLSTAEIIGTVIVKNGDLLKVELQPDKGVVPKIGDKAEFSLQLDSMLVGAGTGKVAKVEEGALWVQTDSDKPDLNMYVTIYATGEAESKTVARQDDIPPLHRCDELTGDPDDDRRIGPAVNSSAIDIEKAIAVCKNAIKEYPKTARFSYQLARVYNVDKQHKKVFKYLYQAADQNYVTAMHALGELYKRGYGAKEKNYTEAVKWYKKAALQGHKRSKYRLDELNEYLETKQTRAVSGDFGTLNFKDPQQVAEAYWNAMIKKNYKKATSYVIFKYREIYRTEVAEGMKALPPFPEYPKVKVEIEGNSGTTIIEDWNDEEGPEMIFREARWWIGR